MAEKLTVSLFPAVSAWCTICHALTQGDGLVVVGMAVQRVVFVDQDLFEVAGTELVGSI